ncbi:MAG: acetolactate synthase small subunit [Deltaproteobacteria bacterium]|nr:acetolactate synthase small subunit [Deltaproteobacteria bacterium]
MDCRDIEYTLTLLVNNRPGVLSRIAGVLGSRGCNIASLCVAPTADAAVSRITLTGGADGDFTEKIKKQLDKLVDVIAVENYTGPRFIQRELMLIGLRLGGERRADLLRAIDLFGGRIVSMDGDYTVYEVAGTREQTQAVLSHLEPFGVEIMNRTGPIAVPRYGSGNGSLAPDPAG